MGTKLQAFFATVLLAASSYGQQGTWTPALPTSSPPARAAEGLAFEPSTARFVVYGGVADQSATTVYSDTWVLEGCSWKQLFPPTNPGPRYNVYMAQSPTVGRVVTFGGGVAPYVVDGSTWEFDAHANTWTNMTPTGPNPPARQLATLAYDSARKRTVLFGGANQFGSSFLNDTWEWDGAAWHNVTPGGLNPTPRAWHSMTFDAARGRTVLFGGYNGGQLGDTWEWDGSQWIQIHPQSSPPPQSSGAIAYDSWSERVVLFAGSYGWPLGLDATWEYDGTDWYRVSIVGGSPPPQFLHRMEGDPLRGGVILFGAFGNFWAPKPETWRYYHASLTAENYAPIAGTTVHMKLSFPGEGGQPYLAAISLSGTCPGIPLPGKVLPLNFDAFMRLSLFSDFPATFQGFKGILTPSGEATPALVIPPFPGTGWTVSVAAASGLGTSTVSVSNPISLSLQ